MTERRARTLLVATIVAAAAVWGVLGQRIEVPTVFGDELVYWDAARALSTGDGLTVRDRAYAFGPLYPVAIAPLHVVAGPLGAYDLARALGALMFSLAAIPVYLLARRLLTPGWSLVAGALAVAAPSAVYTGFVMTEALAYPAACLAFLAIQLAAERPTVTRQCFAIAAVVFAAGVRLQLAVLGIALLLALLFRHAVARGARLPTRAEMARLWPIGGAVALAGLGVVVRVATGGSVSGYGDLWRGYDLVELARWSWYALGGLCLYLAVVPVVLAPAAASRLWRRGRNGDIVAPAFLGVASAATLVLVAVVGAFSSTEFGVGFLHDRYLFYVAPVWIVLTLVWVSDRTPVTRGQLAVGAALAIVLLVTLPTYLLTRDGGRQFDAVATALPGRIAVELGRVEPPRWLALVVVGVAAVVVGLARGRWRAIAVVPVAVVFVANGALVWEARVDAARDLTFGERTDSEVSWVDLAVPDGAVVATLSTPASVDVRDAFRLTEFFNGSVRRAYDTGTGYAPTLRSETVRVAADGRVLTGGEPVGESWVVTAPSVRLAGDLVAEGTRSRLRLWRTTGPPTVLDGDG